MMPNYDLSDVLKHRTGRPFTCRTVGLVISGIFTEESSYDKPLRVGELLELLLLYTVDRKPGQTPQDPSPYLTEEAKRTRFALSLKVRDCTKIELAPNELDLLRTAITVLSTEPNGLVHAFLDAPSSAPD